MCVLVTGVQPCALPIYDSGIGCCRASQQQPGLSDQIQTDMRESYLFFEFRCPRRPFGEALRTDERVVAEHEAVVRQRTEIDVIRHRGVDSGEGVVEAGSERPLTVAVAVDQAVVGTVRSEERGGGKECVRTGQSRWWPDK